MGEIPVRKCAEWKAKACDVCGNAEFIALGTRRHLVQTRSRAAFEMIMHDAVCSVCGLVLASKVPPDEYMFDYYSASYDMSALYVAMEDRDYDVEYRLSMLARHVPQGGTVLEVGAGNGDFLEDLRRQGYMADGFDPILVATRGPAKRGFVGRGGLRDAGFDKEYDCVVSYYVLEHVTHARNWLRKVREALRFGGRLVLEVPDFQRLPGVSMDHQHFLHFTPFHLERLLASLGFEVIETDTAGASRFFGMSLAARLTDRTRDIAMGRLTGVAEERRRNLVEAGHELYRTACRVRESKERQASERAACVARHVNTANGAARVYFWPANEYASRIAKKLQSDIAIRDHGQRCGHLGRENRDLHRGISTRGFGASFSQAGAVPSHFRVVFARMEPSYQRAPQSDGVGERVYHRRNPGHWFAAFGKGVTAHRGIGNLVMLDGGWGCGT